MTETGHLFEEMVATFHPPGVPGGLQAKSSNVQWALRQLWMKNGVEFDLSSVVVAVGVLTHPGAATHPIFLGLRCSSSGSHFWICALSST